MIKKIGFWSVFAIVTGSQIGSGVFILPTTLAPFGKWAIYGWILSGIGAISLCFVFAALCTKFPKTGGPHVYIKHAFGGKVAFFMGWTYWVISWVSTTAVVVATVGYLSMALPIGSGIERHLLFELLLLTLIVLLNLKGVSTAGHVEFFLAVVKFIPLFLLPMIALFFFQKENFQIDPKMTLSSSKMLGQATLLTLWGFIGLETGTTPAGEVHHPARTIPRAIIAGTICVSLFYLINCLGIMGVIPGSELANSTAPYVDATSRLFQHHWGLIIAFIASIVCLANLNAWLLTSGQIALGLSLDHLLPQFFSIRNKWRAPIWSIIISGSGMACLLILTAHKGLAQQIKAIVDVSVVAFLFVYIFCCLSYGKLLVKKWAFSHLIAILALIFCIFVLTQTPLKTLFSALSFTISGIIPYFFWYRKTHTE